MSRSPAILGFGDLGPPAWLAASGCKWLSVFLYELAKPGARGEQGTCGRNLGCSTSRLEGSSAKCGVRRRRLDLFVCLARSRGLRTLVHGPCRYQSASQSATTLTGAAAQAAALMMTQ